jgi:hypothetical protein
LSFGVWATTSMSSVLDKSLEDIINEQRKNKTPGKRNAGKGRKFAAASKKLSVKGKIGKKRMVRSCYQVF